MQVLARNLRAYRRERGISQEELAHRLGVSPRYYGAIERAVQNVTLETVGKIADTIGVNPLKLLAEPATPQQNG